MPKQPGPLESFMSRPDDAPTSVCRHCREPEHQHPETKCLFSPTCFEPMTKKELIEDFGEDLRQQLISGPSAWRRFFKQAESVAAVVDCQSCGRLGDTCEVSCPNYQDLT